MLCKLNLRQSLQEQALVESAGLVTILCAWIVPWQTEPEIPGLVQFERTKGRPLGPRSFSLSPQKQRHVDCCALLSSIEGGVSMPG